MKREARPTPRPSRKNTRRTPAPPRRDRERTAAPTTGPAIPPRWRWHYRALLRLRDHLLREADEDLRALAEIIEPHSEHLADSATDEFEHDRAMALLTREEHALRDVSDALRRIERGTYGVCELSGKKIPAARLRAVPWARYTCAIEEKLEREGDVAGFRVPPALTLREGETALPGTGRFTHEVTEDAEFSGETEAEAEVLRKQRASLEEAESAEFPEGFTGLLVPVEERDMPRIQPAARGTKPSRRAAPSGPRRKPGRL